MVMFGFFGRKISSPDIIDQLMDGNYEQTYNNKDELNSESSSRELISMELIKSAMDILHEQIDFMKEELREKNLLIKALTLRNANESDTTSTKQNTPNSPTKYTNNTTNSAPISDDEAPVELNEDLADISSSTGTNDNIFDDDARSKELNSTWNERYTWQMHSSGAATKIMRSMGYGGKGLGESENGIIESTSSNPQEFA